MSRQLVGALLGQGNLNTQCSQIWAQRRAGGRRCPQHVANTGTRRQLGPGGRSCAQQDPEELQGKS
mgnify:CR=1 FL=1|jgi:hypothetical protein